MNTHPLRRFLFAFALSATLSAVLAIYVADKLTLHWFIRDVSMRGAMLSSALSDSISHAMVKDEWERIHALFERTAEDERLIAIGLCSTKNDWLVRSQEFPLWLSCQSASQALQQENMQINLGGEFAHVGYYPVKDAQQTEIGHVVFLHSLEFAQKRTYVSRQYLLVFILVFGGTCLLILLLMLRQHWHYWSASLQKLLSDDANTSPAHKHPWMHDLQVHLRDIEDNYRRIYASDHPAWNAERLRALLRGKLRNDQIIVLSHQQPFSHLQSADGLQWVRPASGLITALEPVLQACHGTWIAHGSGNADRDQVDAHDRILPTEQQHYTLRRIWLDADEYRAYYLGVANSGIWPLCHMAHVRPVFKETDWATYQQINQRFADTVLAEAHSPNPIVWVQDYQLALAPAMIRKHLPEATIVSFWHIPWPNPESFGICPWREEILHGLLGSTILGFQTPEHRQNFLACVDRFLEARIEQTQSSVFCAGRETFVQSYPISIAWPRSVLTDAYKKEHYLKALGIPSGKAIILGVDRFDYIKGLEERLGAFEHLLNTHPEWQGQVCFVQVAAPTRDQVRDYSLFQARIREQVQHLNACFHTPDNSPAVILIEATQTSDCLTALYQAASACVVSSLHDGMNLVSKEFVAARADERGTLILSCFTGAARELREALIINPYHTEELSHAMHQALSMSEEEQQERMTSLRQQVKDANVFGWAANMLADAERWRLRERAAQRVRRFQHQHAKKTR